jgi:hypothetical protein
VSGWVAFDPLLPIAVIAALGLLGAAGSALVFWRGTLGGALARTAAAAVLVAALLNPSWDRIETEPLSDIVVVLVDESASQDLAERAEARARALARIEAELARLPGTETRIVRVGDDAEGGGTRAMARLGEALADIPRARLAGVIAVTDGQIHDPDAAPDLPAPFHLLLTGTGAEWDRRLVVRAAPAFAMVGEAARLVVRVEAEGAVPEGAGPGGRAGLLVAIGEAPMRRIEVPVGEDLEIGFTLEHAGANVIQLALEPGAGEITTRNNVAGLSLTGVRDRLRVLLVSGEPHAGQRVWRNLLKSDAAVDLVHFTILRPPEKQDGVPADELSLIAFPTRELFVDKITEFDLIIFDRYRRRGILPDAYYASIRDYVLGGGALLVAGGPEFASVESIWRSPLADVLPAAPTSRVISAPFRPALTELGHRHPVTAGLPGAGEPEGATADWGRWFRQVELRPRSGQVVMTGASDRPLLVLDRVGEGRVGLLASDQVWLWGRGFEGGGPQLELLRRVAHWAMKEPELEEERLSVAVNEGRLAISRRTVGAPPAPVQVEGPDGTVATVPLVETGPGLWQGSWEAPAPGLYRLSEGALRALAAVGAALPREFDGVMATAEPLAGLVAATGGGVFRIEDGLPDIRRVAEGRPAAGRGWLGVRARGAEEVIAARRVALLPAWAAAAALGLLALGGWLAEGRRPRRGKAGL